MKIIGACIALTLYFEKPSGIAAKSSSQGADQASSARSESTRATIAIVDGLSCISSFASVMGAENVLVTTGPGWAVAELTTATIGLAACPVVMGADLLGSQATFDQVQQASGLFSPAGMIGALVSEISDNYNAASAEVGSALGDAVLFVKDLLSETNSLKDAAMLVIDGIVVSKEAWDSSQDVSKMNDLPTDKPSADDAPGTGEVGDPDLSNADAGGNQSGGAPTENNGDSGEGNSGDNSGGGSGDQTSGGGDAGGRGGDSEGSGGGEGGGEDLMFLHAASQRPGSQLRPRSLYVTL